MLQEVAKSCCQSYNMCCCLSYDLVPRPFTGTPRFFLAAVEKTLVNLIFLHGCEINSGRGRPGYEVTSHVWKYFRALRTLARKRVRRRPTISYGIVQWCTIAPAKSKSKPADQVRIRNLDMWLKFIQYMYSLSNGLVL